MEGIAAGWIALGITSLVTTNTGMNVSYAYATHAHKCMHIDMETGSHRLANTCACACMHS